MRFGGAATAAIALLLALCLSTCGGGGGGEATARKAAPGPGRPPRAGEPGSAVAGSGSATAGCAPRLHDLFASMEALRRRLAVGLSYEDYLAAVRRAKAAHARIDVERLQLGCVTLAGAPAERALNQYIGAVNTWGDCMAAASCDPESVEPELQRAWRRAAASLAAARGGLRRISGG